MTSDELSEKLRNSAILLRRGSWVAPEWFERAAEEIERLVSELRECAIATGLTTGDEELDAGSLVEPATCLPFETAALVTDRICDRDIRISDLDKQVTELRGLLDKVASGVEFLTRNGTFAGIITRADYDAIESVLTTRN